LLGQLGEVFKKSGDSVAEGELVGKSNSNNTPVYFEIRQRHIAVNPAPWFNES
jgi:septal ring factor EnvC (AmiA/AmiB activator)